MNKAVALVSGGLDSLLAAKIVKEQGIKVIGVTFVMPFASRNVEKYKQQVKEAADVADIPVKFVDISKEFLKILQTPKHGYGANINPCIDCKILMLKEAKKIMQKEKAQFVVTGEVLGERPMSQNRKALLTIKKESKLENYLLRPLSAKLLEETSAEKENIVDREKLLAISGRSREKQLELAKKYGITKYFTPAGGCLLTDKIFSRKLKDLLASDDFSEGNIELLKYGRHFRLNKKTKVIIGRDETENQCLQGLMEDDDILLRLEGMSGPYALLRGEVNEETIKKAGGLVINHSKIKHEKGVKVEFWQKGSDKETVIIDPLAKEKIEALRV